MKNVILVIGIFFGMFCFLGFGSQALAYSECHEITGSSNSDINGIYYPTTDYNTAPAWLNSSSTATLYLFNGEPIYNYVIYTGGFSDTVFTNGFYISQSYSDVNGSYIENISEGETITVSDYDCSTVVSQERFLNGFSYGDIMITTLLLFILTLGWFFSILWILIS
jgi:hypothetical protein